MSCVQFCIHLRGSLFLHWRINIREHTLAVSFFPTQTSRDEFNYKSKIALHASAENCSLVVHQPSLLTFLINYAIPLLEAVALVLGLIPVAAYWAASQWPHWLLSISFSWSGSCRVGEEGCSIAADWWWAKKRRRCATCQRDFEPDEDIYRWIDSYCPESLNRRAPIIS